MNTTASDVIRLGYADIPAAARTLAAAFEHDPLFLHLLPPQPQRRQRLERAMRCVLRFAVRYGEVYATSARMEGVALWLPPSADRQSIWGMARAGVFLLPLTVGWGFMRRFFRFYDHALSHWAKLAPQPHYYLQMLAVDPEQQGRGYSRRLLEAGPRDAADRAAVPWCLDTENPKNVGFYQHLGFQRLADTIVPGTDDQVHCWFFRRDPA